MKHAIFMLSLCTFACEAPATSVDSSTKLAEMTQMFTGDVYDAISVHDGSVWIEVPGAGVATCPTSGCDQPSVVTWSDAYVSGALGSPIAYAAQVGTVDDPSGELHMVDTSGDHAVATGLVYPTWVAASGGRTFVVEDAFYSNDTPSTISCVGCTTDGKATPWISGIDGETYGMIADASNVYVLADDPNLVSVQLLACSTSSSCASEPRVVLGGLDESIDAQELATDGSSVYVARALTSDVVRVDAQGVITPLVWTMKTVTAITWDAATSTLWFGTMLGDVGRVNGDGTGLTVVARGTGSIRALATDATNVYAIAGDSGAAVMKTPK
jgi:hypothetical protein